MAFELKKIILCAMALSSSLLLGCTMKPQSLTNDEQLHVADLLKQFYAQQPTPKTITLAEAIARALKYNLDYRVRQADLALASGQLTLAKWQTLPALNVNYDHYDRNNPDEQFLQNSNGSMSNQVSSVTPEEIQTSSVGLNWNILNFGLSYLKAKQNANDVLIAQEERNRVEQQLVGDVIVNYLKAYSAQVLYTEMLGIDKKANLALNNSMKAVKLRLAPTQQQLQYQQNLLRNLRQLLITKTNLLQAKYALSSMLNLPAGSEFTLAKPGIKLPKLYTSVSAMKKVDLVAIVNRPELREATYKWKNAVLALTSAKVSLLPGVTVNYAYNYTDNYYYVNQNWMSTDIQAAWNLVQMVTGSVATNVAHTKIDVAELERLALTVGVLTQIRLSYLQYQIGMNDYDYASRQADVTSKLYQYAADLKKADVGSENAVVQSAVDSLNARIECDTALATVFDAFRKMYQSVGLNLIKLPNNTQDLESATKSIQKSLNESLDNGFMSQVDKEYGNLAPEYKTPLPAPVVN